MFKPVYLSFSQPEMPFSAHLSLNEGDGFISFQYLASHDLPWETFLSELQTGLDTTGLQEPCISLYHSPESQCPVHLCFPRDYELPEGQNHICFASSVPVLAHNDNLINTYRCKEGSGQVHDSRHSVMLTLATLHCCSLTSASSHSSSSSNQPTGSSSPRSSDEQPILYTQR